MLTEKRILLQWLLQAKLTSAAHALLAEWLEVDSYIIPTARMLSVEAINVLISNAESASDLFGAWQDADIIETYYSEEEQIEVCKIFD